jgi:hypothetical protein
MKLVINSYFGGFGLSDKAIELFFQKKGWYLIKKLMYEDSEVHYNYWKDVQDNDHYWSDRNIDRDDPDLIDLVETLGEEASGEFSTLKVIEIPDDIEWELYDSSGKESVHEEHRIWE